MYLSSNNFNFYIAEKSAYKPEIKQTHYIKRIPSK